MKSNDVEFYERDGRKYVRVTSVLKYCGLIYSASNGAMDRGTVVHACCKLLAQGRLIWDSVDFRLIGYIESYNRLLNHQRWIARCVEQTLYDDVLQFAGTFDVDFEADVLADLKTGVKAKWHKAQCGAYWHLRGEHGRACTIYLQEDGSMPILDFHNARESWHHFQAFLNYYHLKENHYL